MGSNEEGNLTNSADKPTQAAPVTEQSNVHVYHHDWAAMQAYYGSRVAIPQYYNSNVATGHAPPPYMWASPSPMMAPYGAPYPPFCPPGGVYAHPGVQMGSQPQGPVSQATPGVTTPLAMDAPANSPGNTDHGFMKKLKEFDGLAMSISNNKVGSAGHSSSEHRSSQSSENDGSSNGSDGNTTGSVLPQGEQSKRKRRREISPSTGEKPSSQTSPPLRGENEKADVTMGTPVMPTAMDFQNSGGMNGIPQQWNEKEVKREKRKQSNRESARRSRLRKQAETEQLAVKVDALVAENMTLRSKVSQLNDESEKLRLENEALLDQLKAQATGKTENLISRVDKNNSVSGGKNVQHQLLNASPITDPVAAS
ncbi:PREDICTED: G-box-binding factor 2-like isoform X2 [Camelina sativa]|uniref:G-box-binding factor 2-like isoform X2 n=1 Tax=Camelina sativa TaxID=90675 RepID=A0ABM0T970_CAMSA|nr:PREDICTED: G-box-binding factor 2-like isoform X2 [Camelina sativa]